MKLNQNPQNQPEPLELMEEFKGRKNNAMEKKSSLSLIQFSKDRQKISSNF